jgi:peroxiredoxin family protein
MGLPDTITEAISAAEFEQLLAARLDKLLSVKLMEYEANKNASIVIVASKGNLDWAYPPFILGSTAAALGWKTSLLFTVYGLALLKKDIASAVSPVGNPAMPMKMPFGPGWFRHITWQLPNLMMAGLPGFERLATTLMKRTFRNKGVAEIAELRELCIDAGARFYACEMTMQVIGLGRDELIPEVADSLSPASFLEIARQSSLCLYI